MAAGDDTLYLENLEEFVNDEDKIVTYKWLSRTLSVSANKAKQMLYAFVKAQQEERPDISHSITYVVGGRLEIEGNLVHKYVIVTDQDLEDTKKQFSPITCVHIYSVQKCKPKDSNCLYTIDYDIIQEHKKDRNRWSYIHCKEAQCLLDRGVNRGDNRSFSSTANVPSTSKKVNGTSERLGSSSKGGSNSAVDKKHKPSNEKTRKGQMSAMEMFAKKPANTSSDKKEKEENTVKTEGSSAVGKKTQSSSKPGSMKSFFGKAVAGSSATKTSEEKKENKKITPTQVENKDEKRPKKSSKLPKAEEEEDDEEPVPKKVSKRLNRESDRGEEQVKLNKSQKKQKDELQSEVNKRKAKKKRAFIHESDEEPEEETPPVKEQPKENKSKKKRKRTKNVAEDDDSHEEAFTVSNSSGHSNENKTNDKESDGSTWTDQQPRSNGATRCRKRRKVLRSRMSMNEEGYMVTEKVWESESTDASDEEQVREAEAAPKAPRQNSTRPPASAKLLSDAKTNKPGKQASLTSFFHKS